MKPLTFCIYLGTLIFPRGRASTGLVKDSKWVCAAIPSQKRAPESRALKRGFAETETSSSETGVVNLTLLQVLVIRALGILEVRSMS